MTATDALSRMAAGASAALVLFAVMSWLTRFQRFERSAAPPDATLRAWSLNASAWSLVTLATIVYRPVHWFWLMGRPLEAIVSRAVDLAAASLACTAFILLIAARAQARGVNPTRIKRGLLTNCSVALAIVGATWLTR